MYTRAFGRIPTGDRTLLQWRRGKLYSLFSIVRMLNDMDPVRAREMAQETGRVHIGNEGLGPGRVFGRRELDFKHAPGPRTDIETTHIVDKRRNARQRETGDDIIGDLQKLRGRFLILRPKYYNGVLESNGHGFILVVGVMTGRGLAHGKIALD